MSGDFDGDSFTTGGRYAELMSLDPDDPRFTAYDMHAKLSVKCCKLCERMDDCMRAIGYENVTTKYRIDSVCNSRVTILVNGRLPGIDNNWCLAQKCSLMDEPDKAMEVLLSIMRRRRNQQLYGIGPEDFNEPLVVAAVTA